MTMHELEQGNNEALTVIFQLCRFYAQNIKIPESIFVLHPPTQRVVQVY